MQASVYPHKKNLSLQTRVYVINYLANAVSRLRILNYPSSSQEQHCLRELFCYTKVTGNNKAEQSEINTKSKGS